MKAISKFLLLVCISTSVACIVPQKSIAQGPVNFQVFYDDLSPYGNWVDNSSYGYVWVPRVTHGFRPYYSSGYWLFTDDGWTWVSDYSWGWAPFHYGRWFYDSYYGWVWVPDTEWGPAWVCWRRSDDYYGWAPIAPGVSIDIAYSNSYNLPYNQWTFVRNRDFGRRNLNNYYVRSSTNVTIIKNTTVINNIHAGRANNVRFNAGPERTEVEKHAGRTFTPVAIRESNKAGQHIENNQLQLFRPKVERNNSTGHAPVPAKVTHWKNDRPQTNNNNNPVQNNEPRPQKQENNHPIKPKQQPLEQPHNNQPIEQPHPSDQQHNNPPRQNNNPIPKHQQNNPPPPQQQHNNPLPKEQHNNQPPPQQHNNPLPKQQHNNQPQPRQQQNNPRPKEQHNNQPQPSQQHNNPPPRQPHPPQEPRNNPPRKKDQG